MKRFALIAALCLVSASTIAQVDYDQPVTIHNGFISGNDFISWTSAMKQKYAMGLIDGMFLAPLMSGTDFPRSKSLGQCVENMTNKQVVAILDKYLSEHPESWHKYMHLLAWNALKEPCNF